MPLRRRQRAAHRDRAQNLATPKGSCDDRSRNHALLATALCKSNRCRNGPIGRGSAFATVASTNAPPNHSPHCQWRLPGQKLHSIRKRRS